MFKLLGNSALRDEELVDGFERYVCKLYGFNDTNVNLVRHKIIQ